MMFFSASVREEWKPRVLSIVRIIVALLFLQHGLVKMFGFPAPGPANLPPLLMLASTIEIVGSLLLLVGLFTRPVAFIMSGEMAFAYFMSHAPQSFYPIVNRGEAAILFCFIFLLFAFTGGGPWSIDASRKAA
jgi:putative oxidoreductase